MASKYPNIILTLNELIQKGISSINDNAEHNIDDNAMDKSSCILRPEEEFLTKSIKINNRAYFPIRNIQFSEWSTNAIQEKRVHFHMLREQINKYYEFDFYLSLFLLRISLFGVIIFQKGSSTLVEVDFAIGKSFN